MQVTGKGYIPIVFKLYCKVKVSTATVFQTLTNKKAGFIGFQKASLSPNLLSERNWHQLEEGNCQAAHPRCQLLLKI